MPHLVVVEALSRFPDPTVVDALIEALTAAANKDIPYEFYRVPLAAALGKVNDARAAPALARMACDLSEAVRKAAGEPLRRLVGAAEAERLVEAARNEPSAPKGRLPLPLPPAASSFGRVAYEFHRPPERGRWLLAVPLGLLGAGLVALSLFGLFGLGDIFHGVTGLAVGGSLLSAAVVAARTAGRGKGHWFVAFDRGFVFTDGVEITAIPWEQIAGVSCQRQEGFVASVLNRKVLMVLHRSCGPSLSMFAPDDYLPLVGFIDEKVRSAANRPRPVPPAKPRDPVWRVTGTMEGSGEVVVREFSAASSEDATAAAILDDMEVRSVERLGEPE